MENKKAHAVCGKIRYPDISADCGFCSFYRIRHIPSQDRRLTGSVSTQCWLNISDSVFTAPMNFSLSLHRNWAEGRIFTILLTTGFTARWFFCHMRSLFFSMEMWFQIMGILTYTADGVLCFLWLNRHLKKPYSICGAMFLMRSSAVVYHTYAQVMFVDYLPFLLLMLIGVDTLRKTKGKVLLIIGAMCTVMTSFYFAPAAFTAVGIYVLCGTKIESTGKGTGRLKSVLLFFKDCLWQLFPVFYGIVLSAFYLCPVLCTLAGGRSGGKDIQATDLFIPDVTVGKYLYNPYGLGITAIAVMAVCMWIIRGRKIEKERWKLALLLAVIFLLPVFPWLLNGGLYARSKAFLPFLPLVCFLTAAFLETLSDRIGYSPENNFLLALWRL